MTNPKQTYIVASCKNWHKVAFDSLAQKSEEAWVWVESPEELERAIDETDSSPRYIFFLHWNWFVPPEIYRNNECVCFHMTDVPYGRGGSPLQNLIIRGHKQTKLSALRMVAEMDAGPVYAKKDLFLDGTAKEIYLRAGELSFEIIEGLIATSPLPKTQTGDLVTFKRRTPDQSELSYTSTIEQLYDHIRMLDAPTYPHAYINFGDYRLEFTGSVLENGKLTAKVTFHINPEETE